MSSSQGASGAEARYVRVADVAYEAVADCARTLRKQLLSTERLEVHQTRIRGVGVAEDYGVCSTRRAVYVLEGSAQLMYPARRQVGPGHLIVIPAGMRWGAQLWLSSDELVLLEIEGKGTQASQDLPGGELRAIQPEDVAQYQPAGHAKTLNRCLFVDAHMEIIEGLIERGGGAERHAHRDHEQLLYVLSGAGIPLLIHYPKGVAHGTGGGIAEPLRLLVVYSPPLGESQNALA